MRLDIKSFGRKIESSLYCCSTEAKGDNSILILGGDTKLHLLLRKKLAPLFQMPLTREFIRSVYLEIPGQYALIVSKKTELSVISDPYGIIKLYYLNSGQNFILVDTLKELESEILTLDVQAMKYFFVNGYTPSKHTFFRQVSKIEPFTINKFDRSGLVETSSYGDFGTKLVSGKYFLKTFLDTINGVLDFTKTHYKSPELALSGGIDSTFLLMLMGQKKMISDCNLSAFKMRGLGQEIEIDNDYDLRYSSDLARLFSKSLTEIGYDYSDDAVLDDFKLLRDILGCDFAPAMGYIGYCKSVNDCDVVINGQNADSILSFGGMGWPKLKRFKISGLNGFFTRYFQFFGPDRTVSLLSPIAKLLRRMYYRIQFPKIRQQFTRQNYFIGLGLNPENRNYFQNDPAYQNIEKPDELASWIDAEYVKPLQVAYKGLSDHALSVILYNKTYMQGSANRSTVLSALLFKRSIVLPYTGLALLELMTNLRPDWRYVFYGKYPNIGIGKKKLAIPKFIFERQDPNGCDSTMLLYSALIKNKRFNDYILKILKNANFSLYRGILSETLIEQLQDQAQDQAKAMSPNLINIVLRFIWVESTLQKHNVR